MKTLKDYFFIVTGFLSCPCHLPLTLPLILTLTAGTALGAFIAQNVVLIGVLATIYFVAALAIGLSSVGQSDKLTEMERLR